jgi:hypothetical protein
MRKLVTAFATTTILLAGCLVGKAEAATLTNVGSLATPIEEVGYWRGYYGYGYPYYGYGYYRPYPYYGYGYYRPYPYYGYGYYRPYPYYGYGYRWRC